MFMVMPSRFAYLLTRLVKPPRYVNVELDEQEDEIEGLLCGVEQDDSCLGLVQSQQLILKIITIFSA